MLESTINMNTAVISFDEGSSKWIATFRGVILAKSSSKQYVIDSIVQGLSRKAREAKVTNVAEEAAVESVAEGDDVDAGDRFSITERFDFLTDFAQMVGRRIAPSLVVTGEGGLGKTFTILEALSSLGLENGADVNRPADTILTAEESAKLYTVVKGYSTAKGLYRTLYENRNRLIIFDDCDSVLRDATAVNLLKGALDSYEKRVITWNAESFGQDDLPRSFEFCGSVIFISNLPIFKVDQAVRTRAICVDVSMTTAQKIERMTTLVSSPKFMPEFLLEHKQQALEFISKMQDQVNNLSLRTLVTVTKVASTGGNWERRAEYLLTVA